ncbi:hypothetical protein HRbin40_00044 [bacterium HR40]|nr:hypothetical protein HRbin40_00044 [bacterium HR40]
MSPGRWFVPLMLGLPLAATPVAAETPAVRSLAGEPLPLVLRDGRIAHIGVWAIPFANGSAQPEAGVADELERLAATLATDCFLTAQVVGHVAPGAGRDGDTLMAHRLARARADQVQAVLVRHGLSHNAVASVWDWQFSTPESRVTLWVFALVPGEDCEGVPLSAGQTGPAETPSALLSSQTVEGTPQAARPGGEPAESEPIVGTRGRAAATGQPTPPLPPTPPAASTEPRLAMAPSADGRRESATAAGAEVADATARDGATAAGQVLAAQPPGSSIAEASPAPAAARDTVSAPAASDREGAQEAVVAVEFAVNSSFLPQGAAGELERFLQELGDGRFSVRLEAALAVHDVRNARSTEEARRYGQWLAERRAQRLREWLERRAGGRIVRIEQVLVEDDPSRRVVIRARRVP